MAGHVSVVGIEPERLRRIRSVEFDRMVEAGLFAGERLELLEGLLVERSPQSPRHAGPVQRLGAILQRRLGDRAGVRIQSPLAVADDSTPEPDVAVVASGDYDDRHPTTASLVIEVADSSYARDRHVKAGLYAGAAIPEYWIVVPEDRAIEVLREPQAGAYRNARTARAGEGISLVAFPDVRIAVDDVLAR